MRTDLVGYHMFWQSTIVTKEHRTNVAGLHTRHLINYLQVGHLRTSMCVYHACHTPCIPVRSQRSSPTSAS